MPPLPSNEAILGGHQPTATRNSNRVSADATSRHAQDSRRGRPRTTAPGLPPCTAPKPHDHVIDNLYSRAIVSVVENPILYGAAPCLTAWSQTVPDWHDGRYYASRGGLVLPVLPDFRGHDALRDGRESDVDGRRVVM